jgi:alpha-L-fucosidase 2
MIRELLTDVRRAANVLYGEAVTEGDAAFLEQVNKTLEKLLPYKIGAKGNLQEWYFDWEDKDPHHRHQSHLFGLYPGHHITVDDTPELAQACARTLEIKGDKTTGWSAGWRVNLFARLRDAGGAYHICRKLMTFVHPQDYRGEDSRRGGGTYANLFDAHSPFQIDGNFGGTAGVMEMLVQSRWISDTESEAIVLPALPEQWKPCGHIKGVRLRGGYELSMEWKDGKVTKLDVTSHRNTPGKLHVKSLDGQTWEF